MDGTVKSDLRKDNLARQAVDKRHQQATNAPTCWSTCIIGLIIFVLVGFGVGAKVTYSYYGLYWHVHNWYHERDQVLVSKVAKDLNSVLCQSFTVDTNVPASVFLTDGPAKVDKNFKEIISYEDNGLIFDDSFNYRAYYLLQGSKIEIFACMRESITPRVPAEVVIIKSEDQYRKWLSVSRCSDCPLQRIPIPESKLCASFQGINATIHIEEEDTYYIIITRQHRDDIHTVVPSSVTVKISKVMYDSRMSKQHCAATTTCQLDLAFGADDDVIVQFEGNFPASSAYFSNKCRLRVAFWAIVFGAVPGGCVLLLLSCCLVGVCSRSRKTAAVQKKKKEVQSVFSVNTIQETRKHKPTLEDDLAPLV